MKTYCGLLEEIKLRQEAISNILAGKVMMRAKIAEESCFLQLRMICELIALGCLVLHEDLKPKAQLFKTYKADWIISELEKLHPKFFPSPLLKDDVMEGEIFGWRSKTEGFLTKSELGSLWNRHAGPMLHRGSVKNILEPERPLKFDAIATWSRKIVELLNRHTVMSRDEETIGYFIMQHKDHGRPAFNRFAAVNR